MNCKRLKKLQYMTICIAGLIVSGLADKFESMNKDLERYANRLNSEID